MGSKLLADLNMESEFLEEKLFFLIFLYFLIVSITQLIVSNNYQFGILYLIIGPLNTSNFYLQF